MWWQPTPRDHWCLKWCWGDQLLLPRPQEVITFAAQQPVSCKKRKTQTEGETTTSEIGVVLLEATGQRNYQEPQNQEETGGVLSRPLSAWPADTMILDVQPPEPWG